MFPAMSIRDFFNHYSSQGLDVRRGVWSILLAPSKGEAVEFASRYFNLFNKISSSGWHLIVPASCVENNWQADESSDKLFTSVRDRFSVDGKMIDSLCIAFFNPHEGINGRVVFLPLDSKRLADENMYQAGFAATDEMIRRAMSRCGINYYEKLSSSDVNRFLDTFHQEVKKQSFLKVLKFIGPSLLDFIKNIIIS